MDKKIYVYAVLFSKPIRYIGYGFILVGFFCWGLFIFGSIGFMQSLTLLCSTCLSLGIFYLYRNFILKTWIKISQKGIEYNSPFSKKFFKWEEIREVRVNGLLLRQFPPRGIKVKSDKGCFSFGRALVEKTCPAPIIKWVFFANVKWGLMQLAKEMLHQMSRWDLAQKQKTEGPLPLWSVIYPDGEAVSLVPFDYDNSRLCQDIEEHLPSDVIIKKFI